MINNLVEAKYKLTKIEKFQNLGRYESLIPTYLSSGIEVYPHQIMASTFALSNPYVKGFIFADEAGLGKSIEAMLVIGQYLLTNKNKVIVIIPNSLFEQWYNIIYNQFGFNVLPYKSYEDISQLKRYSGGAVVLATYDFITEYYEPIKEMEWDLSVYEEAHRLRKYKIENNKTAEILHDTFANSKKILLTATPIQKNEMDIFGLINFIDETVFTDKDEFYKRYFRKPENYPELRSIIAPYTFRTLRSQVKADVKLPERIITTQIYHLNSEELVLYKLIENYISKSEKCAFPDMQPYELSLLLYGLFSSSIYAFSKTLSGIYMRLMKMGNPKAQDEAKEIKEMLDASTKIHITSKDEIFMKALAGGLSQLSKQKLPKKCIIFTQNLQTQEHIYKVIRDNSDYKVVSYNGSTDNIVLRKFSFDDNEILISTDKGNESLNWQFACFIINYDFPQVLLNMEQRISRCHRIGQKNDTLVINFICPDIFSDVRNYELFYKRTNVYEKILGASDSIISGASDKDIEENLKQAMVDFRNKQQVAKDFKVIDEEFADDISERKIESNDILFSTFKTSLVEKTKNMAEYIKRQVVLLRQDINDLTRFVYKDKFTDSETLEYEQKRYTINDETSLKLKSDPFYHLKFELDQTSMDNNTIIISNPELKGTKGVITVDNLAVFADMYMENQYFFLGMTNDGKLLQENDIDKIMNSQIIEITNTNDLIDANTFEKAKEKEIEAIKEDLINNEIKASSVPIERLTMQAEKKKEALAKEITDLERELRQIKANFTAQNFAEKFELNQRIATMNKDLMKKKENEFMSKMNINSNLSSEIQKIKEKFQVKIQKSNRFMIYFEVR